MDDEENMIVTEVGKFVSVPSSSESAEGSEDTQKKKKKRKKKEVKLQDSGTPKPIISPHTDLEDEPDIRSVDLPVEAVNQLLAETKNSATGWIRVKKALMINTLETQAEPEPKVVALIEELMALKREEVAIRRDAESDGGRVLVSVAQGAVEVESKRRSQLLEAVIKYPRPWSSLGSEKEVQQGLVANTRPLIELEMETRAEALLRPLVLRERLGDSPHCYAQLGPGRKAALGILRMRMDAAVQAVPRVTATAAQMEPGLPVNAWTQYVYDLDAVQDAVQSSGSDLPPDYKFTQEKYLERALEYNTTFNLYTNDYPLLVKREEDTMVPPTAFFEPMDALTDVRHVGGQVVAAIAWHPMHSGEVAVLYAPSTRALLQDRAGPPPPTDAFRRNTILLWSLRDPLKPRSVLSSPREVLAVGWCPVDANILVGVCVSGQVVIWDLTGTWKRGTAKPELSQRRQRARKALQCILQWPDERSLHAVNVAPVALSAPAFSHQGAATDLQWLTPHHRLNCDGHYEQIEDNNFSQQFMTCGEDGAVMVWDLNVVPDEAQKLEKQMKREERPLRKYGSHVSRFSLYHRTMRPVYKFLPQIANRKTTIIFTALAVEPFHIDYVCDDDKTSSSPHKTKDDRKESILDSLDLKLSVSEVDKKESVELKSYRPVERPQGAEPLPLPEPRVWLGTEDGVVVLVRWEGFAFDKGEEVTTEAVEALASCGAVHDGPVVSIQRAPFIPELLLSVGGHVLALWSVARPVAPVLVRRAPVRLTVAAWSPVRPSLLRMARVDGTLEVWDWLYRSDRPVLEQSLSGEPLTAVANCPFRTLENRLIVSVADYRNALHLFYMPHQFMKRGVNDVVAMRELIEREIDLLGRYESWNYKYCTQNADEIRKRKSQIVEASPSAVNPSLQLTAKLEAAEEKKFAKNREKAKNRLIPSKDEEKMLAILLNKKNLDKAELMAKQQPLRLLQQMEEEKKEKSKLKIRQQQDEFQKIVATLLPLSEDEPAESELSEQALHQEVREDVLRVIEEWRLAEHADRERASVVAPLRTLERRKVLEEGAARRVAVDVSLYARSARQERYEARQTLWRTQSNA